MRAVAVIAAIVLVVTHWRERDVWFVLGVVALGLNVVGIVAQVAARDRAATGSGHVALGDDTEDTAGTDQRLSELIHLPGVAAALAAGPAQWKQVSCLEDDVGPCAIDELVEYMWIVTSPDREWEVAVGDEVKPYLDLDVDEPDPLVEALAGHPLVTDAWHEDREVYLAAVEPGMTVEEFAALGARALVAHHLDAVRRLERA